MHIYAYIYIYIYCDLVGHRERKKVLISPTLCVWTKKFQDRPLKGRYEGKSNYHTPWSVTNPGQNESQGLPTLHDRLGGEGIVGHYGGMTGEEGGAKWLSRAFSAKK